jgi:hypothetical protein
MQPVEKRNYACVDRRNGDGGGQGFDGDVVAALTLPVSIAAAG